MRIGKEEDDDIFDLIMKQKYFRPVYPAYKKYKTELLYLFFGGLTFVLVIVVYAMLEMAGVHVLSANAASWFVGVTFSFFTTRKWVFHAQAGSIKKLLGQMAAFYLARTLTLILQELLLFLFVSLLAYNSLLVKIFTETVNIVLNYLVSKFMIFKERI